MLSEPEDSEIEAPPSYADISDRLHTTRSLVDLDNGEGVKKAMIALLPILNKLCSPTYKEQFIALLGDEDYNSLVDLRDLFQKVYDGEVAKKRKKRGVITLVALGFLFLYITIIGSGMYNIRVTRLEGEKTRAFIEEEGVKTRFTIEEAGPLSLEHFKRALIEQEDLLKRRQAERFYLDQCGAGSLGSYPLLD